MNNINVNSEIGKLKTVLLHRPSGELENLTPDSMGKFLFDDIPWLKAAQGEHDEFAKVLVNNGAQVVYLKDLIINTLKDSTVKEQFIDDFLIESNINNESIRKETRDYLLAINDLEILIEKTMAGITRKEVLGTTHNSLVSYLDNSFYFLSDPMPNLYFLRDPFTSLGNGITINKMFYETRRRETLYLKYIFDYNENYKTVDKYYDRNLPYSLEGGDVLVLSNRVIAIGISQRTSPEAIETLAKSLFNSNNNNFDTILAFNIPKIRAYMHLDTVFTQIDYDKFTIHPLIQEPLEVFEIKKGSKKDELIINRTNNTLDYILCKYLNLDNVTLILCGGGNYITSQREQWNDGSNTFAISPGEVVVYSRNYITNEALEKQGVKIHLIPSSELSRGRGGPRCMSMPLIRDDI